MSARLYCISGLTALLLATSASYVLAADTVTATSTTTISKDMVYGKHGYVTISGTVADILDGDRFMLDYGNGKIQVDTNDAIRNWFKSNASFGIKKGDKVTVTGKLDNNWFTKKEIDAYSITHDTDNYTLGFNPNTATSTNMLPYPDTARHSMFHRDRIGITGIVGDVKSKDRFILEYDGGAIEVEMDGFKLAPGDQLKVGDRITVYGKIADNFFEKHELEADSIEKVSYYHRG